MYSHFDVGFSVDLPWKGVLSKAVNGALALLLGNEVTVRLHHPIRRCVHEADI